MAVKREPLRRDWRRELRYLMRFAAVGAFGAVIDYTVLNLLIMGLGWQSPTGRLTANVISTSAAILSNFIWNRRWTFGDQGDDLVGRQFGQFVFVSCIGLVINTVIFLSVDRLVLSNHFPPAVSLQLAKAVAIVATMFWNFAANRLWTFRDVADAAPDPA